MKQWQELEINNFKGLNLVTAPTNLTPDFAPYVKNVKLDIQGDITGRDLFRFYEGKDIYHNIRSLFRFYTKDGGKHMVFTAEDKVYAYPYDGERKVILEGIENPKFSFAPWNEKLFFSNLDDGLYYWEPSMEEAQMVFHGDPGIDGEIFSIPTTGAEAFSLDFVEENDLVNLSGSSLDLKGDRQLRGITSLGDTFFIARPDWEAPAFLSGSIENAAIHDIKLPLTRHTYNPVVPARAHDITYVPGTGRLIIVNTAYDYRNSTGNNFRKVSFSSTRDFHDRAGSTSDYDYSNRVGHDCHTVCFGGNRLWLTRRNQATGHDNLISISPSALDWQDNEIIGNTARNWRTTTWDEELNCIWAVGTDGKLVLVSPSNRELLEITLPDMGGSVNGITWINKNNQSHLVFLVRVSAGNYKIVTYELTGGSIASLGDWDTDWKTTGGASDWFGEDDMFSVMRGPDRTRASFAVADSIDTFADGTVQTKFILDSFMDYNSPHGAGLVVRENGRTGYGLFYDFNGKELYLAELTPHGGDTQVSPISGALSSFSVSGGTAFHLKLKAEGNELHGKIWQDGNDEPETWRVTTDKADEYLGEGRAGVVAFGGAIVVSFKDFIGEWVPVITAETLINGKYVTAHNNRLFVAGIKHPEFTEEEEWVLAPNQIRYSELGTHTNWRRHVEGAHIANIIEVSSNDGDEIMGVVPVMGELFILKGNSTWILYGSGPHNFELKCVLPSLGCIAPDTIATYHGKVIFLSNQGVVMIDEGGVQILSDLVAPELKKLSAEEKRKCVGGVKNNQYWFSFG